jgi:benzoyl-CoA reductase/2-hydroxyglutaryl-CoA dehydratase subunit BcrC/BadD/HgdB
MHNWWKIIIFVSILSIIGIIWLIFSLINNTNNDVNNINVDNNIVENNTQINMDNEDIQEIIVNIDEPIYEILDWVEDIVDNDIQYVNDWIDILKMDLSMPEDIDMWELEKMLTNEDIELLKILDSLTK